MKNSISSTWIEIDLDLIKKNMQNIRNSIDGHTEIMGIVKGNAYGHDAIEISNIILENGATQLAVARIEEAIILRNNRIKAPILVLSISPAEQMHLYLDYHIMPTICDLHGAVYLNELAKKNKQRVKIHLKIETGMGRLGLDAEEVIPIINKLNELKNLEIQGIYTHFSTADEADKEYTYRQFAIFKKIMNHIQNNQIDIPFFHVANSGTILDLSDMQLDMVRPGCLIYGLYPSADVKKSIHLFPALSFKTCISFIKKVQPDHYIGYGRSFKTEKETIVATLPVGYADGYSRNLSNLGEVLVRGKKAPVIGRICMDQMMIDISDIPDISLGDEVVLWGRQMEYSITVEEIALKLKTIVDEVVHLTDKARVPKLFIKEGKPWKVKSILGEYIIR